MENTEEQSLPRTEKSWAEILFFILLIGSVFVTYYKIVAKNNYLIEAQTDCDPTVKNCFIWNCDPESTEDGEACTGDAEVDTWYYKLVTKNAANVPLCDPEVDENCTPLVCELDEKDCMETFCDDESKLEQGVECSNPEEYLLNNPPEEDEAVEDGDAGEADIEESEAAVDAEEMDAIIDDAANETEGGSEIGDLTDSEASADTVNKN
ncbi:MAG: hypothetical protein WAV31_04170 [Candidatus Moraniibacteriota bacterium]